MELASLLVRIGITGTTEVKRGLSDVERGLEQTGRKAQATGVAFEGYELPLLRAAGAAGSLLASIGQASVLAAGMSGIIAAARWQRLEIGFTNILGSAKQAKGLLGDIKILGATTEFNTEELTKFARLLLATGSNAKGVLREIKAIGDAVSTFGGTTADVDALSLNLSQIRQAPTPNLIDLKQFGTRGINLDKVVSASLGKNVPEGGGIRALQGMTGHKAFDTIITGFEKAFGGNAVKNAGSFLGILQNIGETFQQVMIPTGNILLPILSAAGGLLLQVGNAMKSVNEVTGGSAGLILMIWGLYKAKSVLIGSLIGAVKATRDLTAAMMAYAGVATAARATTTTGAAARAAGGILPAIGAGAAVPRVGLKDAIKNAGGILPFLKTLKFSPGGLLKSAGSTLLKGAGGLLKGGGGILADLGLNFLGDKVGGTGGGILKGIGSGVGLGSLGFIFGPVVGGITTAIGALAGGIYGYFNSRGQNQSDPVKDELKKQTDVLKDIRADIIGGGDRTRRAVGSLELEASLGRIIATGIG